MSADPIDTGPDIPWLWVLAGVPAGLLAAYDPHGAGVWWLLAHTVGWLWRLPYVAPVVCLIAAVTVVAVGVRAWRGRDL